MSKRPTNGFKAPGVIDGLHLRSRLCAGLLSELYFNDFVRRWNKYCLENQEKGTKRIKITLKKVRTSRYYYIRGHIDMIQKFCMIAFEFGEGACERFSYAGEVWSS